MTTSDIPSRSVQVGNRVSTNWKQKLFKVFVHNKDTRAKLTFIRIPAIAKVVIEILVPFDSSVGSQSRGSGVKAGGHEQIWGDSTRRRQSIQLFQEQIFSNESELMSFFN